MALLLNSDLGEIEDPSHAVEHRVMPFVDMANIACGFHAGSPSIIVGTLNIAKTYGVSVGAHPGYGDKANFGRFSIPHTREELIALLHYQIAALEGMARRNEVIIDYVKPHGALYNDMMADRDIRDTILRALASEHGPRKLVILATGDSDTHRKEAKKYGIELVFETFADRSYNDKGQLLPRSMPGSVHSREPMLEQVQQLLEENAVTSNTGKIIPIDAQTLCIHGDSPESVETLHAIHNLVKAKRR